MDNQKDIQANLCKGLRACGLPRKQSLSVLNDITKWYHNNGPEWTVSRLKDIRQWYETYLAGDPNPPAWCRKSKDQLPVGIWGWLFKQPTGKVLGVLSSTTVFKNKKPSTAQIEKFNHGLRGNGFSDNKDQYPIPKLTVTFCNGHTFVGDHDMIDYLEIGSVGSRYTRNSKPWSRFKFDPITIPDSSDITGNSIPIESGKRCCHPETLIERMDALVASWRDIPQPTLEFLLDANHLDQVPIDVAGNVYQLELDRPRTKTVGRIGCIQNGELKARWIANPNRVVQHYMRPLQNLYMEVLRFLPTDCTHDQERGITWVQEKLKEGVTLSGSDLTSASDLLDRDACAEAVKNFYRFDRISDYDIHERHFLEVSGLEWYDPYQKVNVTWKQGQPLGTAPSFGLMGLTNNLCGFIACHQAGIDPDSFRVIGDDMIIDHRALSNYNSLIKNCFGGEINHSKTLTSSKVAEFAGRVITPNRAYLKKVSFTDPSDQNFLAIMSQLGPQASHLLRPRQRRAFNEVKFVPGIAVEGPWLKDSYGEPFETRYRWYLESPLSHEEPEPDRKTHSAEQELLAWQIGYGKTTDEAETKLPYPMEDSYLESQISANGRLSGDPRKVDGLSTLDVIENHIAKGSWESYNTFKQRVARSDEHADYSSKGDDRNEHLTAPDTLSDRQIVGDLMLSRLIQPGDTDDEFSL